MGCTAVGFGIGTILGFVISARRVRARAVEKSLWSDANSKQI